MPTNHVVSQGECLSRIADLYGFSDYRTIYDHPTNADLRQKRPNPHLLYPGDVVIIPDKYQKSEDCATGKRHSFKLHSSPRVVRLMLKDEDDNPLANKPYQFTCEGAVRTGRTDGNGMLEESVPIHAEDATLECAGIEWPLKIGHLNPLEDVIDDGVSGYQARLHNLGYNPGPIDGILGPKTKAAVRAFQADYPPLQVDGICGPKTRAKLKEVHGS